MSMETSEDVDCQDQQSPPVCDTTSKTSSKPPDGGIVAWTQVFGCFWIWFNTWGLTNTFGVFQTYYQHSFSNKEPDIIALIGCIQPFVTIFGSFLAGPVWDAGYCKMLVAAGMIVTSFAYFMTSICQQFWQVMLAQGILAGCGSCMSFAVAVAAIPQYFTSKKALANGVAAAGSGLGGVIYPVAFRQLLQQMSFGWSVRVLAFLILTTYTVPLVLIKQRVQPDTRRKIEISFTPLYREPAYGIWTISLLISFAAQYTPAFFLENYARNNGIVSGDLASYILPVLNAASIPGRIAPSFMADKVGGMNVLILAITAATLLAFCWIAVSSVAGCFAFAALYGFCVGVMLSVPNFVTATLCPDPKIIGARSGTALTIGSFGLLLGPTIAAAIFQHTKSWIGLQVFAGSMLTLSLASLTFARVFNVGWSILRKA